MKYLVLHQFRTFGKTLHKGQVVDESEIRSPTLRMSEGKITPAVSSSTVPEEEVTEITKLPPLSEPEEIKDKEQIHLTESIESTEVGETNKEPVKPIILSLHK